MLFPYNFSQLSFLDWLSALSVSFGWWGGLMAVVVAAPLFWALSFGSAASLGFCAAVWSQRCCYRGLRGAEGLFLGPCAWHSWFYALAHCLPLLQLGHIIGLCSDGKRPSNRKMWHLWLFPYTHSLLLHHCRELGPFYTELLLFFRSLLSFRGLQTVSWVVEVESFLLHSSRKRSA